MYNNNMTATAYAAYIADHQHMTKRLKSCDIQNQCSWWDLDDEAILDWASVLNQALNQNEPSELC